MAMPSIQNRGVRRYENSWASISLMLLISGSVLVGLYGCGVAEGPAYLRFEGNVVDKEGQPAGGQEVQIQVEPNDLNSPDRSIGDELILTNADGKFTAQRGHWTGGLLIIPMALIVAPISGLVAAVTPWTFHEVQDFFSPVYLIGSTCLSHPTQISVIIATSGQVTTFSKKEIRERLYKGKDRTNGKYCTRVYGLGEFTVLPAEASS